MEHFSRKVEVRWADLDPNFHVLHSKYLDFGAYCRMAFLTEHGLTIPLMKEHHIGPIIFREECFYKREIRFGDEVSISLVLDKVSEDHRKWSMSHEIWINGDTLAATISLDGAWLDTEARKVAVPPEVFQKAIEAIPRSKNFNQ